jgi:hypothetical protein
MKNLRTLMYSIVAALVFFLICGTAGAILGYLTGTDPLPSAFYAMLRGKGEHLVCAKDSAIFYGLIGTAVVTPIFFLVRFAQNNFKDVGRLAKALVTAILAFIWLIVVLAVYVTHFLII